MAAGCSTYRKLIFTACATVACVFEAFQAQAVLQHNSLKTSQKAILPGFSILKGKKWTFFTFHSIGSLESSNARAVTGGNRLLRQWCLLKVYPAHLPKEIHNPQAPQININGMH